MAVGGTRATVGKIPRIGYLSPSSSAGLSAGEQTFLQELRDLGYVEGKNVVIEHRFAEGKFDRLTHLAAELVQLKVDVIASVVTQASLAARDATTTIPIVMVYVSDPVGSGLIANFARPGGNITGTSGMTAEVAGKSLELLKEAVPQVSRVAILWNPNNAVFQAQMLRATEAAAAVLRVTLQTFGARGPDELDGAFAAIAKGGADALLVFSDPILNLHQKRIVDFAERSRLPAMYGLRETAADGGLMAYGPDRTGQYRRAASYVDKILKGAKPADLPIEQPTKFEFIVNLKTAKTLSLSVPLPLLGRADEVIE